MVSCLFPSVVRSGALTEWITSLHGSTIIRINDTRDVLRRTAVTSQGAGYAEAEMTRYFFHLRSDDSFVWNDEGVDLPDPLTAQGAADKTAAELRGGLLHQVRHDSCWTAAVRDESGEIIHTVAL